MLFEVIFSSQSADTRRALKSAVKFSAAGKCSTEILPCLERIAEFIDQQAKSKQATAIIKDFIARVPAKLIQTRFHSEDTEAGFSTIAMTLLKVRKIKGTILSSFSLSDYGPLLMVLRLNNRSPL